MATFELEGQSFNALNGGSKYKFNEAIFFFIEPATPGFDGGHRSVLKYPVPILRRIGAAGVTSAYSDATKSRTARSLFAA